MLGLSTHRRVPSPQCLHEDGGLLARRIGATRAQLVFTSANGRPFDGALGRGVPRAPTHWSRLWAAARCHDANMLELRPTCENCNRPLPRDAPDAMICTIECTFCRDCVETVLSNVCPNCAGGFERRPIRPAHAWVEGAPQFPPPSTKVVHKPVDPATHAALVASVGGRSPSQR